MADRLTTEDGCCGGGVGPVPYPGCADCPRAPQTTDVDVLAQMAAAIAAVRRADDLRVMGRTAPGDSGPYLPMDMRAAKAALTAYRGIGSATDHTVVALRDLLALAERQALQIECEWGEARATLESMEAAGDMPDEILNARKVLGGENV